MNLNKVAGQIDAAKEAIGALRQASMDIIVMPGSDVYVSQQEFVSRGTVRKLHRDYGQATLPYSYKYGPDWQESLKALMKEKIEPAFNKNRGQDPRMLLYLPITIQDRERIFEPGGIMEEYAHLEDYITIILVGDVPESGVIDNVMHIVLAKALLNYERIDVADYGEEALGRLARLIGTLVDKDDEFIALSRDPEKLIEKIINGGIILRVKRIDFKEIQEWKAMQDEVLRAL